MTSGKKYLRAAEIATLTGVTVRAVRRWIADEVVPSVKLGGARLVPTEGLEAALSPPRDGMQDTPINRKEYEAG